MRPPEYVLLFMMMAAFPHANVSGIHGLGRQSGCNSEMEGQFGDWRTLSWVVSPELSWILYFVEPEKALSL